MSDTQKSAAIHGAAPHPAGEINHHIAQNIDAVRAVYARAEQRMRGHQRLLERVTAVVSHALFPYCALALIGGWAVLNVLLVHPYDPPPFSYLQGGVSLCALLIATMVLSTQNRQSALDDQRSHLELQINLLSEQKIAKLIALVEELRRDMPTVKDRVDSEADVMQQPADPQMVLDALNQGLESASIDAPDTPNGARGTSDAASAHTTSHHHHKSPTH